jgi:hypothetical protein
LCNVFSNCYCAIGITSDLTLSHRSQDSYQKKYKFNTATTDKHNKGAVDILTTPNSTGTNVSLLSDGYDESEAVVEELVGRGLPPQVPRYGFLFNKTLLYLF